MLLASSTRLDSFSDLIFIELGAATLGLALLSRLASRIGISAIPFYLLAGLTFGNGGLLPLPFSESFVHVGAEIGVVLLLFTLGLEYTGRELLQGLRSGLGAGVADLVVNFAAGVIAGWLLGWPLLHCLAFGGITYVSSSGVIAKIISESGRQSAPETPVVVSMLVFEDLAMAVYLPVLTILLTPAGHGVWPALAAVGVVAIVLLLAAKFGDRLSKAVAHKSDEIIILTSFGAVLLVAGLAQRLQVSAAVGAFLVGIALSGPVAEHAGRVIAPIRDLFAAVFFFFFGLQVAPAALLPILPVAAAIAVATSATKVATGWWAARQAHLPRTACLRAGTTLIARGEFSIVIAGVATAAGAGPALASIAAAYVLITAIAGPIAARLSDRAPAPIASRSEE